MMKKKLDPAAAVINHPYVSGSLPAYNPLMEIKIE